MNNKFLLIPLLVFFVTSCKEPVKRFSKQEIAEFQYCLGFSYQSGEGVEQDCQQAAHWYELAANQGLKEAQYSLAYLYNNGEGVAQDCQKAAYWYELAANQGHARAQCYLARLYDKGQGVTQDDQKGAAAI